MKGPVVFLTVCLFFHWVAAETDTRIYTFAVGKYWPPFEFISDNGDSMGFTWDVIREVCERANKRCSLITYKDYTLCWNNEKMQADALHGRYWDVCAAYPPTKERQLVHGFFGEIGNLPPVALFVRGISGIGSIHDIDTDETLFAYRPTYYYNDACIERALGAPIRNKEPVDEVHRIIKGLKERRLDIALLEVADGAAAGLRQVGDPLTCADAGPKMMVRKEVLDDFKWFDPVLKDVIASDYYKRICAIAKKSYGGDPRCFQ